MIYLEVGSNDKSDRPCVGPLVMNDSITLKGRITVRGNMRESS